MQNVATNPRWLFIGRALSEAKTLNAIITLFYLARGVSIDQLFILSLIFSVASIAFEVPTGWLADRFGRKNTLIVGVLALIAANVGSIFAHGFPQFGLVFILLSFSASCFSGTEEALLYDSLKETGREKEMGKYNGQLHAARSVLKIFLPTLGALIATQLLEWQFILLIGIDVLASLGAMWCFTRIVEPRHHLGVLKRDVNILRQSVQTIRQHPFLFRATMNKTLIFTAAIIAWRIYQPILTDVGITAAGLALFYFLMHASSFSLRYFAEAFVQKFGLSRVLVATPILMLIGFGIFFLTQNAPIMFVCLLFIIVIEVVREPLFSPVLNARIAPESRATTLSNLNLVKSVLDIPIFLLCSAVATAGATLPLLIAAALTVLGMICFPLRQRELA